MAANDDFTLNDFRKQLEQLKKMGPMKELLSNMPGLGEMIPDGEDADTAFKRVQAMIDAMTEEERRNPDGIDLSHRQRIAAESGANLEEVERFLEQFRRIRKLMRYMGEMSVWQRIKLATGFERLKWDEKE